MTTPVGTPVDLTGLEMLIVLVLVVILITSMMSLVREAMK